MTCKYSSLYRYLVRSKFTIIVFIFGLISISQFSKPAVAGEPPFELSMLMLEMMSSFENHELTAAIEYSEDALDMALEHPDVDDETLDMVYAMHTLMITMRGLTYLNNCYPELAIEDFTYIIEMGVLDSFSDPDLDFMSSSMIYGMRGFANMLIGKYDDAIHDIKTAEEKRDSPISDEDDGDDMIDNMGSTMSYFYYLKSDFVRAREHALSMLETNADDSFTHCLMMDLALATGDTDAAKAAFDEHYESCTKDEEDDDDQNMKYLELIKYVKENNSIPDIKEFCAGASGATEGDDFDTAIDLYEVCSSIEPSNEAIAYNLATVNALAGNNINSLFYFSRYLYLAPYAPDRNEVLEMIDELRPDASLDEMFYDFREMMEEDKGDNKGFHDKFDIF